MALTGQLSDMSLAELIEFFCNQRKTGRLKVDYHRGHGVFFIKDGELVDAKVGALSGAEAVYFALTLPNAAFDFSSDIEPPRRSIKETWTQVVLEGLRRLDEGMSPGETDAFGSGWAPSEADMAAFMGHVERLGAAQEAKQASDANDTSVAAAAAAASSAPMSMMVESANEANGGKRKMVLVGVAACLVLACAVAAIPLAGRLKTRQPAKTETVAAAPVAAPEASAPVATSDNVNAVDASSAETSAEQATEAAPTVAVDPAAAALAARREREARERAARERERKADEAKRAEATQKSPDAANASAPSAPAAPAATGPKSVRVSVAYDEAGRVTQASVAGATPGAEAYGGTAVRIARGRRFPAGKAGATVVTIPVN